LHSALARRGHDLHVFAKCHRPGLRNALYFDHHGESAQFGQTYLADVLVVVPEVLPLPMPVPPRAWIVWTGNAFTNGGLRLGCPCAWGDGAGRGVQNARLYSMALLQAYVDRVVVGAQWSVVIRPWFAGDPSKRRSSATGDKETQGEETKPWNRQIARA